MTYPMQANRQLDKVMSEEQFDLVIDAILAGKYSWACVLILRFGGYNPLHYMPYRTYNRLMKKHRQGYKKSGHRSKDESSNEPENSNRKSRIKDLAYLETVDERKENVRGGYSPLNMNYYTEISASECG